MQVIPNGGLTKVICCALGAGMVQVVFDCWIGPPLYQQPHHGQATVLRRHVHSGHALSMRETAESSLEIYRRPVIDQPISRFEAIANGRPDQWRSTIRV